VGRPGGSRGGLMVEFLRERDHELKASLFGIEAVAVALTEQRDRLSSGLVDQLALTIASEARRLRQMLAPPSTRPAEFDLAAAIRPAIVVARAMGVVVQDSLPAEMWVRGWRDQTAQVVLALLDNARVHAAPAPVDVRALVHNGTTTLYVEDRGPGLSRIGGQPSFEHGGRGVDSPGSGLGLCIARRLMLDQGGSLTADSRPGGGASFALSLPSSPMDPLEVVPCDAPAPAVLG